MWYLKELLIKRMYVRTNLCTWFGLLLIVLGERKKRVISWSVTSYVTLFRLLHSSGRTLFVSKIRGCVT